jgi:LPXTG-motif cell wall-anchored protein
MGIAHVNQTTLSARLRRGAALGLGVVLLSGATLAVAAPAQAAPVATHIAKADIGSEVGAAGWQTFSPDGLQDVGGALSIAYANTITNTLETPEPLSTLSEAFAEKLISWTTSEDTTPSALELTVRNSDLGQSANIRYVGAVSGTNTPGLDSSWIVWGDVPGLTFGEPATLETILPALEAAGMTEVSAYGINSETSASYLSALDIFGTAFTFGGPPSLPLEGVTVTVTGSPVVGQTLSVTTAGWPAGTELSYEWFWNGGMMGGGIEGASGTSYTVTGDLVTRFLGVIVTGTAEGFSPTTQNSELTAAVTATQQPAAAAPVADSSGLAAFLASAAPAGIQSQEAAGLPAGSLNAGTSHSASIAWESADNFVDVYAYSSPLLVGTFAVVDGAVQIELSTGMLTQLSAGDHTLVVVGQSSKAAQAYALNVTAGLAETGTDPMLPLGAASLMLLLGAALFVARRRRSAQL